MPHRHEGIRREIEHLTDRSIESAARTGRMEQLRHSLVAPSARDICQERLTVAVWEESGIIELAEAGQRILCRICEGPSHPHGGQPINGPERGILRHPFDEPERELGGSGYARLPVADDVVLERVCQLVADDVVEVP